MKRSLVVCACAMALVCAFGFAGCGSKSASGSGESGGADANATASAAVETSGGAADAAPEQAPADNRLTYGSTFDFDGKSITIGEEYFTTSIDNQFSDHSGETVIGLPVSITSTGDETSSLNMYSVKEYGSAGTELDPVYYYFDDDVRMAGNVRPGATQEGTLYFLYDGNGDYYLEFGFYKADVEVALPIEL